MATISPNDSAPAESVHYTFAGTEFDLGGRNKKHETADPSVIASAVGHPWLHVQHDKPELVTGSYVEQLTPADDAMSRVNDKSNDPDTARAAEAAKVSAAANIVGIQAGLDQTVPTTQGPVAQTLAADPTSKTSDKVKD